MSIAGGARGRFAAYFKVRHYEMDALGHVNNAVYLHYMEQAAIEHAEALGFGFARWRALGGLFIARRHEIDYLRPASAGDILVVITWVVEMRGAQSTRDYTIVAWRPNGAGDAIPADGFLAENAALDGPPIARARTVWAFIDIERSRPRRIPPDVLAAFAPPMT